MNVSVLDLKSLSQSQYEFQTFPEGLEDTI